MTSATLFRSGTGALALAGGLRTGAASFCTTSSCSTFSDVREQAGTENSSAGALAFAASSCAGSDSLGGLDFAATAFCLGALLFATATPVALLKASTNLPLSLGPSKVERARLRKLGSVLALGEKVACRTSSNLPESRAKCRVLRACRRNESFWLNSWPAAALASTTAVLSFIQGTAACKATSGLVSDFTGAIDFATTSFAGSDSIGGLDFAAAASCTGALRFATAEPVALLKASTNLPLSLAPTKVERARLRKLGSMLALGEKVACKTSSNLPESRAE
mmetsp:Transcript_71682/g.233047  ORF Transcript_71682/g.233047 Transcript_71682/m.233047 type:complete len:279 (+) Transcript_71682:81-917(+)